MKILECITDNVMTKKRVWAQLSASVKRSLSTSLLFSNTLSVMLVQRWLDNCRLCTVDVFCISSSQLMTLLTSLLLWKPTLLLLGMMNEVETTVLLSDSSTDLTAQAGRKNTLSRVC